MRIEIKTKEVRNVREYKGRNYGEQSAALHVVGADYPLPFKINVPADEPHPPGNYALSGDSFHTDEHSNLRMKRVRLVALPPVKA